MNAHPFIARVRQIDTVRRTGRIRRVLPTFVEADGPAVPIGALCRIATPHGAPALAHVAAVHDGSIVLVPLDVGLAAAAGAEVEACADAMTVPVGDAFLGRAVDGLGRPIDGQGPVAAGAHAPLVEPAGAPLLRADRAEIAETGVRAIDALLTLGQGQRVGLFAASGVGKTTLVNQLARQVGADRCVVCLVGERGREVESLWSSGLGDEAKGRSVLVAATSDETAAMRVRACDYALALAAHWRAEGHHVLFLLDSVTRLAMALREIGLAAGEPPTVRAYTPSVFAALPKLVERCGALKAGGATTAIMTVLCETDDADDPVAEAMKSLLDGHILLSRSLAERGHFPAIDVPRSISRLAPSLLTSERREAAARALEHLSVYESARLMIEAGVYAAGSNCEIDRAVAARPALLRFLRQGQDECVPAEAAHRALAESLEARA